MTQPFIRDNFLRPRRRSNVTILMGGISGEREISLSTGTSVGAALQSAGYNVRYIDVGADVEKLVSTLNAHQPDAVFNGLHGKYGEDGAIQGLLDMMTIPYTHSGRLSSSLAMDKSISRLIFGAADLPIAPGRVMSRADYNHLVKTGHDPIKRPYVVKPVAEGSSLGVSIIRVGEPVALLDRDEDRHIFGDEVLLEEYIPGRELTVGVIGTGDDAVSLGAIDIRPKEGFFDYRIKYAKDGAEHIIPPLLPKDILAELQNIAVAAHRLLGCRCLSRSDFRLDDSNAAAPRLVLLEVNSQPGMTNVSLVPDLAQSQGFSFTELVTYLVEEAKWGS